MKLLDIFNVFKKKETLVSNVQTDTNLPEDLERFRIKRWPEAPPEPEYPEQQEFRAPPVPEPVPEVKSSREMDKTDFILEKLETIDARLKLIEERLRK